MIGRITPFGTERSSIISNEAAKVPTEAEQTERSGYEYDAQTNDCFIADAGVATVPMRLHAEAEA